MDNLYESLKKSLDEYKAILDAELNEIRQEKMDVQKLKELIHDQMNKGQFIRDNKRIIISAPEILIGNLNRDGELEGNDSTKVIIRSNNISLQGVANYDNCGRITNQATIISNICVDTGIDGLEEVVMPESSFTTQAKSITLQSNDDEDFFYTPCIATNGINLKSDSQINMNASLPNKNRKKNIEDKEKSLKEDNEQKKERLTYAKKEIEIYLKRLQSLTEDQEKRKEDEDSVKTDYQTFYEQNANIRKLAKAICSAYAEYTNTCSIIAENTRKLRALQKGKEKISNHEASYEKDSTRASVNITAENTSITSADADGNIRTNDGAGVSIKAKEFLVDSNDAKGEFIEKSKVQIQTHDFNVNTVRRKKIDDNNFDFTAEGDVHIISKNIIMESVDQKQEKDKVSESALTKEGSIKLRAENLDMTTYDTEGNAGGKFSLNSKDITLKSMNVDKESKEEKEIAENSMVKMLSGSFVMSTPTEKKIESSPNRIQVLGGEVVLNGEKHLEIEQGEKAKVELESDKLSIKSEKNLISGETEVNDKTTFKQDTIIHAKATIDNAKVNSSLEGPVSTERK